MSDSHISVDHDGNVTWFAPLKVAISCTFNVRYFPYDTQFCSLVFASWSFNAYQVDIQPRNIKGTVNYLWLLSNIEYNDESVLKRFFTDN